MKIHGIGIDLVKVSRIASALQKQGQRFMQRCFTQAEVDYCSARGAASAQSFAGRWAAKEAVAKAFGTGIGQDMGMHEIEITNLPSGQPVVTLHGHAKSHADKLRVAEVKISLTHTDDDAAAYAMVLLHEDS